MSQWDVAHLMEALKDKYPHIEVHQEICLATQVRQEAVAEQAGEADLLIVVGDPLSNNSNRLRKYLLKLPIHLRIEFQTYQKLIDRG